jgi:hypothetical protein
MKSIALTIFCCFASLALGQGSAFNDIALQSTAGLPGATITVGTSAAAGTTNTPRAVVYSDASLSSVKTQPISADTRGNYSFYAAPATYRICVSAATVTTYCYYSTVSSDVSSGAVVDAYEQTGSDACAQIAAAIAALPSTGGVVDATRISGAKTCAADPFSGVTKVGTLLLGCTTYTTDATWVIPNKWRVIGPGRSGATIKASASLGSNPVVRLGTGATVSFGNRLENVTVDCNSQANVTGVYSTSISEQSGIKNVNVTNVAYRGIDIDASSANGDGLRAEHYSLEDFEVSFATGNQSSSIGLRISGGATGPYVIRNATINGVGTSVVPTNLVSIINIGHGLIQNIHVENGTNGIDFGSVTASNGFIVENVNGPTAATLTTVINLPSVAGVHQGFSLFDINRGGATNAIDDTDRSLTVTDVQVQQYTVGRGTNRPLLYIGSDTFKVNALNFDVRDPVTGVLGVRLLGLGMGLEFSTDSGLSRSGANTLGVGNGTALDTSGRIRATAFESATTNRAAAGVIRCASADTCVAFKNNAAGGDINGLKKDTSDIVQVGDTAGVKIAGPLTGVTTGAFSDVITSTKATGTAPFTISSTTPVANLTTVPATYSSGGTQQTAVHLVFGKCTLGTDCSITLSGSAVFTGTDTYECTATDQTAAAAVRVNQSSGSAVAFTGTGTDVIRYQCIGN